MKKARAFTLTEMVIVVVLVGILASMALPRYIRVVEKGRTAEARHVLGLIRDAEIAYYLEFDAYVNSLGPLGMLLPNTSACNANYYFYYTIAGAPGTFRVTATRCTGSAGKRPGGFQTYVINITEAGVLNGTVGFF